MKSLAHCSSFPSLSNTQRTLQPASAYCYWVPTGTGMPMLTRRVPTSSMTPWYLQVASTCAHFYRDAAARVCVSFIFFDLFQVAKEHSPSESVLIHLVSLRRGSRVIVYISSTDAFLHQFWYKPIRPHLTAKTNARVGLLDSRSWWSHAQTAAPLGAHMDLPLS